MGGIEAILLTGFTCINNLAHILFNISIILLDKKHKGTKWNLKIRRLLLPVV